MRLTFLGTGGGRFATIRQTRWTGGIYVEFDGQRMHVDPGPGALLRMKEKGLDPTLTDTLFVSHRHPDHCTDAEILVVAMTAGKVKPHAALIGSQSVIQGSKDESPSVSSALQAKMPVLKAVFPGDRVELGASVLTVKPAFHSDPSTVGFILESEGAKLGYLPDTEYHASLGREYAGCDLLVVQATRPRNARVPFHLSSEDVAKLLSEAKPRRAALTHFGERMIRESPDREAAWIASASGVDVIPARDGMYLEVFHLDAE